MSLAADCCGRDEVDGVHSKWIAAGADDVKTPQAVVWDVYSSCVAVPDGHLWEIDHNPMSPNDESGHLRRPD